MPFKDGKPDLAPKQEEALKLLRSKTGRKKYVLFSGTRWAGKSVCGLHALCDHAWNTRGGSILVLCWTAGTAATSGIWNELTEKIMPEWIEADFGMKWEVDHTGKEVGFPRIHGATKKMMCSVINKHGVKWIKENEEAFSKGERLPKWGVTKIELDSLDDEREVEKRYKSRYYSMIYWSEAGEFQQELSLTTLMASLRVMDLPSEEHILLIDVNPAESGESHFLYKYFYEIRIADDLSEEEKPIQACLHLIEWTMDDNPYLSDEDKAVIKSSYKNNPSLWSRYVLGKWIKVVEKGLFTKQFSRAIHVVGDPNEKEPEILVPMEGCTELSLSFDPGGSNPHMYFYEKCILHYENQDISIFRILDELAYIDDPTSVEEFIGLACKKMDKWEQLVGINFTWPCWSDRSALDFKESIANRTVADEVFSVSNGRIRLMGVDKGAGSVGNRIRLLRKLLAQRRIIVSAAMCPKLVEMFENINCGKIPDSVATHSKYKHAMDAISYGLSSECWAELQDSVLTIRTSKKPKDGSGLISVRM